VNLPQDWPLLAVAAGAVALAVFAGPVLIVAVGAGLVATLAVALLLLVPMRHLARPASKLAPPPVPAVPFSLIESFRAGRAGREEIVHVLDRIERAGPRPNLPVTTDEEVARLRALSHAEFRAYVRGRLTVIEHEVW
jgi:hypothetical protein